MSKIIRIPQETVHFPVDICDAAAVGGDWVNMIADFIDIEISNERTWINGVTIKVESVEVIYGDNQIRSPCVHSGEEFRRYINGLNNSNT